MDIVSDKLKKLLEVNRILSSTLDLSELLHRIMQLATDMVDAESSSLLLYNPAKDELFFDLALTDKESEIKQVRLKMGEGIAGTVADMRKTEIVNDVKNDKRWIKRADEKTKFITRSIIAVPMVYKDKLLGVIEAVNKKHGAFNAGDAEILEAFSAQSAVAVENANMFKKLLEDKEKISAMFSKMSDGAISFDSNSRKLIYNESSVGLLGKDSMSKDSVFDIFSGFSFEPSLDDMLSSRESHIPFDAKRACGKRFFLSGTFSKIFEKTGKLMGILFIFRDVTEEKNESLIKKNFLSLVSHKLKTPLATITGYTSLLSEDKDLSDFHKKAVLCMDKQGKHLANLVDKLLDFSLIESERLSLDIKKVKFKEVLDAALSSLKVYLSDKNALIEVEGSIDSLPQMYMDSEKIVSVIKNLLENAVKFVKEKPKVSIKPVMLDKYTGLEISDNGPGIPPEEHEKIFQKFYQIEESFTGQVEGAGLGLSLTKQVVEAHGGRISLKSAIGKGSVFTFVLPK